MLGGVSAADRYIPNESAYCYLLGINLGDGHLTYRPPSSWSLRVANDQRYTGISNEIMAAMVATLPWTPRH